MVLPAHRPAHPSPNRQVHSICCASTHHSRVQRSGLQNYQHARPQMAKQTLSVLHPSCQLAKPCESLTNNEAFQKYLPRVFKTLRAGEREGEERRNSIQACWNTTRWPDSSAENLNCLNLVTRLVRPNRSTYHQLRRSCLKSHRAVSTGASPAWFPCCKERRKTIRKSISTRVPSRQVRIGENPGGGSRETPH